MEQVNGRYVEDVREFVLSHIETAIQDINEVGNDCDRPMMNTIHARISSGSQLSKEHAKWLETSLSNQLHNKMDDYMTDRREWSTNIMEIDSLSIYSDAWGLYCRPGRYLVSF